MKKNTASLIRTLLVSSLLVMTSLAGISQVDSTKVNLPDTAAAIKQDEPKEKKDKRKDEFLLYAGVNFNTLSVASDEYDPKIAPGYQLGFSYKRGKFFYWQVGLQYSNPTYRLEDLNMPGISDSTEFDDKFSIREIGLPVTGGINFLSATNRIVALRLYLSAIPSYAIGVGDNDLGIDSDSLNGFNLYGQAGLGVSVFFLTLDAGVNYGFMDALDYAQSKPFQVFVNLGFRF